MKQLLQQLVNIHLHIIVFFWKNLRGKDREKLIKNRKKSCSRIHVPVFAVHTLQSPCICKTKVCMMIALLLMYTLVTLDSAVGGLWPVWFIFSLLLSLHNFEMSTGSEHLVSSVAVSARLNLSSIVFSHSWVICLEIELSFFFLFQSDSEKIYFEEGKKQLFTVFIKRNLEFYSVDEFLFERTSIS